MPLVKRIVQRLHTVLLGRTIHAFRSTPLLQWALSLFKKVLYHFLQMRGKALSARLRVKTICFKISFGRGRPLCELKSVCRMIEAFDHRLQKPSDWTTELLEYPTPLLFLLLLESVQFRLGHSMSSR